MTRAHEFGTQWAALLAPASDEDDPGTAEYRLERALAAVGASAWEWVAASEEASTPGGVAATQMEHSPAQGCYALVHPAKRVWLPQAVAAAVRGNVPYDLGRVVN